MNLQQRQLEEKMERQFHRSRRASIIAQMKPVSWNGLVFESTSALARHLRLPSASQAGLYIKAGRKLKGFLAHRISKEDYEKRRMEIHQVQ